MSSKVKKWGLVTGMAGVFAAVLVLAVVAGGVLFAATTASAQQTEPTPGPPWERGWGFFGWGGPSWTLFDTIAEALGLTPSELFTESHDEGKSVTEIAEERGVDLDAVKDALNARRAEGRRQAIQQAVEDGRMSQQQADWLLEGMDKGFYPGGRGMMGRGGHFGFGRGFGGGWFGPCRPAPEEG